MVVVNNRGFIDYAGGNDMILILIWLLVLVISLLVAVLCAVKLGGEADDKAETMSKHEVEK